MPRGPLPPVEHAHLPDGHVCAAVLQRVRRLRLHALGESDAHRPREARGPAGARRRRLRLRIGDGGLAHGHAAVEVRGRDHCQRGHLRRHAPAADPGLHPLRHRGRVRRHHRHRLRGEAHHAAHETHPHGEPLQPADADLGPADPRHHGAPPRRPAERRQHHDAAGDLQAPDFRRRHRRALRDKVLLGPRGLHRRPGLCAGP
mmetsp:Transcript_72310/g.189508  ORF Transcript_72310/g.189508 Transcript_72310/m.189508 type:complete len:202 (+) Transcript_72310:494-1099(+)